MEIMAWKEISWKEVAIGDVINYRTRNNLTKNVVVLHKSIDKNNIEILTISSLFEIGCYVLVHDGSYNDPEEIEKHLVISEKFKKLKDEKLVDYYINLLEISTIPKLKKIAKKIGLKGYSKMKKQELIDFIFEKSDYTPLLEGMFS